MAKPNSGRRQLIVGAAALCAQSFIGSNVASQPVTGKVPNPKSFRTGDFIWPKKDGQFVPYAGTARAGAAVDEQELNEDQWNQMRIQYIRRARSSSNTGPDADYRRRIADRLEEMTYSEFFHEYAAGVTPDRFQTYGLSNLFYVGHMAILDVDADGAAFVVEAVLGQSLSCRSCVQRVSYQEWLKARGDIYVWHGRLRNSDATTGAAVAKAALAQAGKPYDFLNWDLLDESGFYCSKLAWYAAYKGAGVALDADTNPKRNIWFSPLQAVRRTKEIELLFNPGNYQNL
jgi:cell wall-associated NlpC family hydrolase